MSMHQRGGVGRKEKSLALLQGQAALYVRLDPIDEDLGAGESQSLAVLSFETVTMRPPSGENTALLTAAVTRERYERPAVSVPEPRRSVSGGGQDAPAVRRKYRSGDKVGVPPVGSQQLAVAIP
jgi:hypothetical protein